MTFTFCADLPSKLARKSEKSANEAVTHQIRQTEITSMRREHPLTSRPVAPPVSASRVCRRHVILALSLLGLVLLPLMVCGWYLWARAADQYASTVAFSVRKEEQSAAISFLGGFSDLGGTDKRDADVLYEFLQSQELVASLNRRVGIARMWSLPGQDWLDPAQDPIFSYGPDGTVEDLVSYWRRMVRVGYDAGTGLIEIRVLAFAPDDATMIAHAILDESSKLVNSLSAIAQEDTIRAAREDLRLAEARLKSARQEVTAFRNEHSLVDPGADSAAQAGLLGQLQVQLAEAMIEADMLKATSSKASDPRLLQTQLRIEMIEHRISEERAKLGLSGAGSSDALMSEIVGRYEALVVDREFAEASYTAALAAFDAAQAEARRKSRYLAAHIQPTRAESSRFPERGLLLVYVGLFLSFGWGILVLGGYAIRDRR